MLGALLGGLGLFLLGMSLLTDGLQSAAGDRLRQALRRLSRSRAASFTGGVAVTAIVQSSTATSLATIGFVGAGLLPLEAALAVLYGANVGTTSTAWAVSAVGLKVQMNAFALPMVGAGALVKVLGSGRRAALGSALAGLGLVFVGIDVLQEGMASLADRVDVAAWTSGGVAGTLVLVAIGAAMTVVMQSSTAAVATTLAAVHAGAIGIVGAAALVIGQNVGTTTTALIASAGGAAPARRAALAHLAFNIATAVVAVALLPLLSAVAEQGWVRSDPAVAVAAFHSAFNILGAALFLPFTVPTARWLERCVKDRGARLTRHLGTGRMQLPEAQLEAAHHTTRDIFAEALEQARAQLLDPAPIGARQLGMLNDALARTRSFLDEVHTHPAAPHEYRRHVALLHSLDHLIRLCEALAERDNQARAHGRPDLASAAEELAHALEPAQRWCSGLAEEPPDLTEPARRLAERRREQRPLLLERAAAGEFAVDEVEGLLEAMRWVDRIGYHCWRALHHLRQADAPEALEPAPAPRSRGIRGHETYDVQA